jgi:hypothetical protein
MEADRLDQLLCQPEYPEVRTRALEHIAKLERLPERAKGDDPNRSRRRKSVMVSRVK